MVALLSLCIDGRLYSRYEAGVIDMLALNLLLPPPRKTGEG